MKRQQVHLSNMLVSLAMICFVIVIAFYLKCRGSDGSVGNLFCFGHVFMQQVQYAVKLAYVVTVVHIAIKTYQQL